MFMQTHLKFARVIYQAVQKDYPHILDYTSFLFGNVLPDFDPRLFTIPHTKDRSLGYLSAFTQQYRCIPRASREKQSFSCDMGIIAHFICDYFCQAHSYAEYDNYFRHLYYETQLANEVASIHIEQLAEMCERIQNPARVGSVRQLPDFINFNHQQYKKENRRMATDIIYSLKTAADVIKTTINYDLGRELAKVS